MYSKRFQILMIVAIVLFSWAASSMAASKWTPIGEWQDFLGDYWKQTIRIYKNGDYFRLECSFPGESPINRTLIPLKAKRGERKRFRDNQSDFKEEYAILSNGDLALYDQEGFIRKAMRK